MFKGAVIEAARDRVIAAAAAFLSAPVNYPSYATTRRELRDSLDALNATPPNSRCCVCDHDSAATTARSAVQLASKECAAFGEGD